MWARVAVSLVRDADGRPKFGIRMVEDTTERKRAEESLRASEERYRGLFENANDMVYTLDLAGHFTAINRAGERITGHGRTYLLGRALEELLAPGSEIPPGDGDAGSYECEIAPPLRPPRRARGRIAPHPRRRPAGRHPGDRPRRQRAARARGAAAPGPEDGGRRPARGRRRARLQQPPDRDHAATASSRSAVWTGRLQAALEHRGDQAVGGPGERASPASCSPSAASRSCSRSCSGYDELVGGLDAMLRRLIGEDIELVTRVRAGPRLRPGRSGPARAGDRQPGRQRARRDARGRPADDRDGERRARRGCGAARTRARCRART